MKKLLGKGDGECDDHLKNKNECNFDSIDCCPHDKKTINDGNCDHHMAHVINCTFFAILMKQPVAISQMLLTHY